MGKGIKNAGEGGLGARDRGTPAIKTLIFSFQRPQNSDWLIFDSMSHGNDVIFNEDVQLEDLNLVAAGPSSELS